MKECKYCRTQYDDNLVACPNCGGTKVFTAQELAEEASFVQREEEYKKKASEEPKIHKMRIIGVLAAIAVVIAAVVAVVIINANKPLSNGMTKDEGKEIYEAGITHLDNEEYQLAIECFSKLPPDSKQYKKAQSMISKAKDGYYEKLLSVGKDHLENKEYEPAMDCFQQLPSDSNQYAEAQSLLSQSQNDYRKEIIERVNTHIDSKEYEAAFDLISKAQAVLPDDSELKNTYENVYSAYISYVEEQVSSYVSNSQYELAIDYLDSIQAKFPNDAKLQDLSSSTVTAYHTAVRTEACNQADIYLTDGDYVNAIKTVKAALDKIGADDELNAKLSVCAKEYVPIVIKNAEQKYTKYNAKSIYAAEEVIKNALALLPDNNDLNSELNRYKDLEPAKFLEKRDSEYASGSFSTFPNDGTYGNSYSDIIYVDELDGYNNLAGNQLWNSSYMVAYTDFQYKNLTGTLFQNKKYSSASTETTVYIVGYTKTANSIDENPKILWKGKVSGNSKPANFNVDISGMRFVAVYYVSESGAYGVAESQAYLADIYLWK